MRTPFAAPLWRASERRDSRAGAASVGLLDAVGEGAGLRLLAPAVGGEVVAEAVGSEVPREAPGGLGGREVVRRYRVDAAAVEASRRRSAYDRCLRRRR